MALKFLRRFEPQAYALLRIVAGLLFLFHGLQKFGFLGGQQVPLASLRGAAAVIEVVGGALVMIGLLTAPAAFICSGEMAYAYFTAHQPKGTWPIQNQGELASLYAFPLSLHRDQGRGHVERGRQTVIARTRALPRPITARRSPAVPASHPR